MFGMRSLSRPVQPIALTLMGVGFLIAGAVTTWIVANRAGAWVLFGLVFMAVGAGLLAYVVSAYALVRACLATHMPISATVVEVVDDTSITINNYWACRLCCHADDGAEYYSEPMYAPKAEQYMGRQVEIYIKDKDYFVKYK